MKVAKSLRSTPRVGAACTVRRFVLLCWRAAGAMATSWNIDVGLDLLTFLTHSYKLTSILETISDDTAHPEVYSLY